MHSTLLAGLHGTDRTCIPKLAEREWRWTDPRPLGQRDSPCRKRGRVGSASGRASFR